MGELGAPRLARGARRVDDHGGVVGSPPRDRGRAGSPSSKNEPGRHEPGRPRPRVRQQPAPGDQQRGAGVGERGPQLAALEVDVERDDDRARAQDPVVRGDELGHVGQHQRDPVAGADAVGLSRRATWALARSSSA